MYQPIFTSDTSLALRIGVGCAIFASFAWVDFRRNRWAATRWREYSLLLASVVAALFYGTVNDQITVTISPEYFLYGKELFRVIGDDPSSGQLRWEAAKVGLKATWSVGLIFGVMLLLANNPYGRLPRLRNRQLLLYIPFILLIAGFCGVVGGCLGYHGFLDRLDSDFQDMIAGNVYRPRRFICCWGVHLGGYFGGLLGAPGSVASILFRRLALRRVEQ